MRARTVLSAVAVAAVGASLVILPSPAQAATIPYHPVLKAISAPAPKAMREAKGHLFVSTGNTVLVLSGTGALEKTFTGMFGAAGMTVSPDGATVYVALSGSGQVAVVDTATLTVTSTWTTAPCTTSVALSAATLFYSYGCDSPSAKIGAIATADGAAQDTGLTDTFAAPPMLAVAGTTLVAGETGVTRYDISGSTLTAGTDSATASNLEDLAASPDGTSIATASGGEYHLVTRSPGDLAQTATFDTGPYPTAVAFSHNSSLIAGGLWQPYDDELFVFNRSTGAKVLSSGIKPSAGGNNIRVISGTVVFSDDDSLVYALAQDYGSTQTYLVTSTTAKPKTSSVTLTVKSPAHVGNHLVATAHVGLPGVRVTFTAATNGKTVTHTATANSTGVATWTWLPTYSGTITATYAGDVTHSGSSRAAVYRAPSTTTVQLSAGYKHRYGVTYYRSANKVAAVATVHPVVQGRVVTAGLYAYRSGHWSRVDSLKLSTDSHGRVGIYLTSARTKTLYKVTFTFSGDTFNTASSASTTRFEIG